MSKFLSSSLLLASVLALGVIPCRATLGETVDQCTARYGLSILPRGFADPNSASGDYLLFDKDGYEIHEFFIKGIVESEYIKKKPDSAFSDKEKEELLQAEGGKWTKYLVGKIEGWHRDDGAIAAYSSDSHTLRLYSERYTEGNRP